jgi:hypothetical protein
MNQAWISRGPLRLNREQRAAEILPVVVEQTVDEAANPRLAEHVGLARPMVLVALPGDHLFIGFA